MLSDKFKVAVIGYAGDVNSFPVVDVADTAYQLGCRLAEEGYIVLTGGRDGIMHLVSKGASEKGAIVLGVTPYSSGGITPYAVEISTGLDMAMRSGVLLNSADAVVSIGGAAGTAIEIFMAYSYRKPLILIENTGGWTDRLISIIRMEEIFANEGKGYSLDYRKGGGIFIATSVDEVIDILKSIRAGI